MGPSALLSSSFLLERIAAIGFRYRRVNRLIVGSVGLSLLSIDCAEDKLSIKYIMVAAKYAPSLNSGLN